MNDAAAHRTHRVVCVTTIRCGSAHTCEWAPLIQTRGEAVLLVFWKVSRCFLALTDRGLPIVGGIFSRPPLGSAGLLLAFADVSAFYLLGADTGLAGKKETNAASRLKKKKSNLSGRNKKLM